MIDLNKGCTEKISHCLVPWSKQPALLITKAGELVCPECAEGYFINTDGRCSKCSEKYAHCNEC